MLTPRLVGAGIQHALEKALDAEINLLTGIITTIFSKSSMAQHQPKNKTLGVTMSFLHTLHLPSKLLCASY